VGGSPLFYWVPGEIAGGGEIVAPCKFMKLDWKAASLVDSIVQRTCIDQHDLIDDGCERFKAGFDESGLVSDDEGCRNWHKNTPQIRA